MDEKLNNVQESVEMTDEKLDEVSGGLPTAYYNSFTYQWCPYCKKQHKMFKGTPTTITVMTYKQETVSVTKYWCDANCGDGVMISRPARAFYVEDAGGAQYYFDDSCNSVK